jgi:hypothetical protein
VFLINPRPLRARGAPGNHKSNGRPITATTVEAIEHADRFARYAVDGLPHDQNAHPGIHAHLTAARVQLEAALKLAAIGPPPASLPAAS